MRRSRGGEPLPRNGILEPDLKCSRRSWRAREARREMSRDDALANTLSGQLRGGREYLERSRRRGRASTRFQCSKRASTSALGRGFSTAEKRHGVSTSRDDGSSHAHRGSASAPAAIKSLADCHPLRQAGRELSRLRPARCDPDVALKAGRVAPRPALS
jgi:hypothetical protein